MKIRNIYLYSLTALSVATASSAYANQMVTVPTLEGGIEASVGAWYATPSADNTVYGLSQDGNGPVEIETVSPGYDFGMQASIGYVFDDTANDIVLSYRGLDTTDTASLEGVVIDDLDIESADFDTNLGYELNTFDLMIGQFINIGESMQMHFAAGASYVELEQEQKTSINDEGDGDSSAYTKGKNEFRGWGPRLDIDARYDFGQGFGIVAGGAVAYFLGEETVTATAQNLKADIDDHAVVNLRGNIGIDYVYFFDNDSEGDSGSVLGLEVGYLADYYDVNFGQITGVGNVQSPVTFSGPYVNLKGAF